MKSCIQKAIESLCDDIRGGMDATANYQRAEAVMMLAFSDMLISDEITTESESEGKDDASMGKD